MSRAFPGTVSPYCLLWNFRMSIAEYRTWSTSCSNWQFFCFSVFWWCQRRVRKKTADEIPVEGNCRQFWQGASVWAAWGAPFPRLLGWQWKQRRANSGLFRIHPGAPLSAGGFPKFIFGVDKIFLKWVIVYALTTSPAFPRFLGRQWKQRRADPGLFRIQPRAPPPAGGFSKFVYVAENCQPSSKSGYFSSDRVPS